MEIFFIMAVFVLGPAATIVRFVIAVVQFARTPKTDDKRRSLGITALISGILMVIAVAIGAMFILSSYIILSDFFPHDLEEISEATQFMTSLL